MRCAEDYLSLIHIFQAELYGHLLTAKEKATLQDGKEMCIRDRTQPGVVILPQVEQTYGEKAVEAHVLRRIFTTIRILNGDTLSLIHIFAYIMVRRHRTRFPGTGCLCAVCIPKEQKPKTAENAT